MQTDNSKNIEDFTESRFLFIDKHSRVVTKGRYIKHFHGNLEESDIIEVQGSGEQIEKSPTKYHSIN